MALSIEDDNCFSDGTWLLLKHSFGDNFFSFGKKIYSILTTNIVRIARSIAPGTLLATNLIAYLNITKEFIPVNA